MLDLPQLQNEIEKELAACIAATGDARYTEYEAMFAYQMDWENGPHEARGKRVRPLLVLLATHAVGGEWQKALPAAASLELMHNFSLIHDDIQDQSPTRRGKPTLWMKWGEPLAINAGDAMLALSSLALQRLQSYYPAPVVTQVAALTHTACLDLTRGQFLDISFEKRKSISLEEYWEMLKGKTCSLLAAALEIGGLLGGANEKQCQALRACGLSLGRAYQVQDDWLGIWGDAALTGKSTESDLMTRKKSYPILAGIASQGAFYQLWSQITEIDTDQIPMLLAALAEDGIKEQTEAEMAVLYRQTLADLETAGCSVERSTPLRELFEKLIRRAQ